MKTDIEEELACIRTALREHHQRLRRLEGVEGPEQGLVAATAEQAKRQGAAEDLRERGRVAPVEAQAALRVALEIMAEREKENLKGWRSAKDFGNTRMVEYFEAAQRELFRHVEAIEALLPEPESEADAGGSTPTLKPSTEAPTPTPTGGKRSGRRNDAPTRPAQPPRVDSPTET